MGGNKLSVNLFENSLEQFIFDNMNVLAKKLSIIERIAQTESEDLLEQIDVLLDQGATLSPEHQEIVNERLAAHQANPELGLPWTQVKEKIKRGLDS